MIPTIDARACLAAYSQEEEAATHLWQMPDLTFGMLLHRLLLLMDIEQDGDLFLACTAGKAFQKVVHSCTERVLSSPRFPDILGQLTYKVGRFSCVVE